MIGVVVFQYLHPHCIDQPTAVYYSNPYADRLKPAWADAITHAEYPDNKVTIVEGLAPSTYINDYEVTNTVKGGGIVGHCGGRKVYHLA